MFIRVRGQNHLAVFALTVAMLVAASIAVTGVAAAQRPSAPPGEGAQRGNDEQLHVFHVQGNVYLLASKSGNMVVQISPPESERPLRQTLERGEYGLLLVDTLSARLNEAARAAVQRLSKEPIRHIINTHVHGDHVGGNAAFAGGGNADGTLILAHENALARMAAGEGAAQAPPAGLPTDAYLDVKELWLNGESIQVLHQPSAHTDGDSIVYFRRSDVIAAGDIYTPTGYPVIDQQGGGSLGGIIDGLNHILDLAIPSNNAEGGTLIVPGHGRLSDEYDVVEYRNMVVTIRDRIKALVEKGQTLQQVKAAQLTLDYDHRYGASTGPWTTDMFIEAIYRELAAARGAQP